MDLNLLEAHHVSAIKLIYSGKNIAFPHTVKPFWDFGSLAQYLKCFRVPRKTEVRGDKGRKREERRRKVMK